VAVRPLGSGWVIEWNDVRDAALPGGSGLDVSATVVPSSTPQLAETRLSAVLRDDAARRASIHGVWYPIVDVNALPSDDLSLPLGSGAVLEDVLSHPLAVCPTDPNQRMRHPGPASMQWFCLFPENVSVNQHPSFYLATQDQHGVYKEYCAVGQSVLGSLRMSVRHVPADSLNVTQYGAPFPTVLGSTGDDWYSAAERYRGWAETASFTARGPFTSDPDFSEVIRTMRMFGTWAPDIDFREWWPWQDRQLEQSLKFGTADIVSQNYGWYPLQFDSEWGNWEADPDWVSTAARMKGAGVKFSPYTLLHVRGGRTPDRSCCSCRTGPTGSTPRSGRTSPTGRSRRSTPAPPGSTRNGSRSSTRPRQAMVRTPGRSCTTTGVGSASPVGQSNGQIQLSGSIPALATEAYILIPGP